VANFERDGGDKFRGMGWVAKSERDGWLNLEGRVAKVRGMDG
jgi:hypothetical protein